MRSRTQWQGRPNRTEARGLWEAILAECPDDVEAATKLAGSTNAADVRFG
jgi:hypothetical protein